MSVFPNVPLIQRKKTGGGYVKGQWVPGTGIVDKPFVSSWQPVNGKALEQLPEGKRSGEVYRCYPPISMDFTTADAHSGAEGDIVIWKSQEYEVTLAARWDNGVFPHWEVICTRPKEGQA
jgi:hypothetical protein